RARTDRSSASVPGRRSVPAGTGRPGSRTPRARAPRPRREPSLRLFDHDGLGPFPEAAAPDLAEAIGPALIGLDRREVVGGELPDLRARRASPVGKEDLALADAARIHRELARS